MSDSNYRPTTIENVGACVFEGKALRDMDRDELLKVLVWVLNDAHAKREHIDDLHKDLRKALVKSGDMVLL